MQRGREVVSRKAHNLKTAVRVGSPQPEKHLLNIPKFAENLLVESNDSFGFVMR